MLHLNSPLFVIAAVAIALFSYATLWALFACVKKRGDLADIAWGYGFLIPTWLPFLMGPFSPYALMVNVLVTLWAVRLSLHIYFRNRKRDLDFRYKGWTSKKEIFVKVFWLQALLLFIIALPIQWIGIYSDPIIWSATGIALPLWIAGFCLETISDYQLSQFLKKRTDRKKILTTGCWSWVRHPNYLGEILQWWAIWVFAVPLPFGWTFIVSPLLITFLIVNVSGVAPLEEKMKDHPEFAEYAKKTPSLFPRLRNRATRS